MITKDSARFGRRFLNTLRPVSKEEAQVGEVHDWKDGPHKKVAPGEWVAVAESKPGELKGGQKIIEVLSQKQAAELASPPNKKGDRFYNGVNIKDIKEVLKFDPAEFHIVSIVRKWETGKEKPGKGKEKWEYTDEWNKKQAEIKMARIQHMQGRVGAFREMLDKDIQSPDEKTKACATIMRLIDTTYMRIGGSKAEEETGSSGASTLKAKHIKAVEGGGCRIRFRGKSGVKWDVTVTDPNLSKNILAYAEGKQGGEKIFPVSTSAVQEYVDTWTESVEIKDFRTFHASRLAFERLLKLGPARTEKKAKENVKNAVKYAASNLNHSPAVCLEKYINPMVIANYLAKFKKEEAA